MPFPLKWSQQVSLLQEDLCGCMGVGGDMSRGLEGGGMERSRIAGSSRKDLEAFHRALANAKMTGQTLGLRAGPPQ